MTACDATWPCWCCRTSSNEPGAARPTVLAGDNPARPREGSRLLLHGGSYWDRNGPCSSKGSTTRTTSGSTIGCETVAPDRYVSIPTPGSTTREAGALLENHDEPRAAATFPPGCTRRRRSSPPCRPGCGSSTRVSSRVAGSAFRRTSSAAARSNRRRAAAVLRPPAHRDRPSAVRDGDWRLLESARVGRQLDVGLFRGVALDEHGRRPPARGGQLRATQGQCYVRCRAGSWLI